MGLGVGEGVGIAVDVGVGVVTGDCVGLADGLGDSCFLATTTPLFQTNFLPLLMQVYFFPL